MAAAEVGRSTSMLSSSCDVLACGVGELDPERLGSANRVATARGGERVRGDDKLRGAGLFDLDRNLSLLSRPLFALFVESS